jgi:hypothetical protein
MSEKGKTMNAKKMLKEAAQQKRKIFRKDRMKLEVITDTAFYKKGQIIEPHIVMGEQLVKDKIAKAV